MTSPYIPPALYLIQKLKGGVSMGFAKGFIAGALSLAGVVIGAAIDSAIKDERAKKLSTESDEEKETEANEDETDKDVKEMSSQNTQKEKERKTINIIEEAEIAFYKMYLKIFNRIFRNALMRNGHPIFTVR